MQKIHRQMLAKHNHSYHITSLALNEKFNNSSVAAMCGKMQCRTSEVLLEVDIRLALHQHPAQTRMSVLEGINQGWRNKMLKKNI